MKHVIESDHGKPDISKLRLVVLKSKKDTFKTLEDTWLYALDVAKEYGWRRVKFTDRVPATAAVRLLNSLKMAYPNMNKNIRRPTYALNEISEAAAYFSGKTGRRQLKDLISFVKQGEFTISYEGGM
jgi:hypothetical protein